MAHDHDSLFRLTFSQPEQAVPLLRTILSPVVANAIDWGSLRLEQGSFVDDALKTRCADLLFTARMGRRRILVHLVLEHKSGADRWTALQLLRYVVRVFDRFLAENPKTTSLPPVLPIVVHHGARGWTAPRNVLALVDLGSLPPSIRKALLRRRGSRPGGVRPSLARHRTRCLEQPGGTPLAQRAILLLGGTARVAP